MLFQFLKYLVLFILLILNFNSYSKEVVINFKISPSGTKVKLFSIYGSDLIFLDSTRTNNEKSSFKIHSKNYYKGFYRLTFNDTLNYDFVIGCQDSIYFELNAYDFEKSLRIINDKNNILLLSFKKELSQLVELHQALLQIPIDDLNPEMKANIEASVANYQIYKNELIKNYSKKFDCDLFQKLIEMNNSENSLTIQDYFTKFLPLQDSSVIHTTSFNQSLIDFYGKFGQFNQESFEQMTDTILFFAKSNKQNYDFTLNYLFQLFSKVGPQSVFYFLINRYYDKNIIRDFTIQSKIDKYLKFKPGTEINISNVFNSKNKTFPNAKKFKKNKYNLIVWWDPQCDHCLEIIPELNSHKWERITPAIYTIALTENEIIWQKTIDQLKLTQTKNYLDKKAWESNNTKNLLIYKTPFFILLDNKGSIIAYDVDYPEILTYIK